MIVNKKKIKISVTDLILMAAAILFWIGIRYWFPVCAPMGDSFMTCHWAGEMLKAISWLFAALCAVHAFLHDAKLKCGLDLSLAGLCVLICCTPGKIISVCQDAQMHCRGTQVWAMLFSVGLILLIAVDVLFYLTQSVNEKHKKN